MAQVLNDVVAVVGNISAAVGDLLTAIGRGNIVIGMWVVFVVFALICGDPEED